MEPIMPGPVAFAAALETVFASIRNRLVRVPKPERIRLAGGES